MRAVLLLLVIAFIACLNLAGADPLAEEQPFVNEGQAAALLDLEAGAEHANESPREARGFGGYGGNRGYGGFGGYGGYGGNRGYGGHGGYGGYGGRRQHGYGDRYYG